MRILDINNVEIESPDFNLGYLKHDTVFVQHHEAVEAVEEQGHEEIIAEYKNHKGEVYGRDVAWIVDVEAVEAKEAWDEYEDIQRYVLYTEEELAEIEKQRNIPTAEERIAALEAALLELMGVAIDG